jgi:hypothetical protein
MIAGSHMRTKSVPTAKWADFLGQGVRLPGRNASQSETEGTFSRTVIAGDAEGPLCGIAMEARAYPRERIRCNRRENIAERRRTVA